MGACGRNAYERNQLYTIAGAESRYSIYVGKQSGDPEEWNRNISFHAGCDSACKRERGVSYLCVLERRYCGGVSSRPFIESAGRSPSIFHSQQIWLCINVG